MAKDTTKEEAMQRQQGGRSMEGRERIGRKE